MTEESIIDPEKKERIENLIKSFREIDACIEPFSEQKKELRTSYLENEWLTKDEFNMVKKAYNFLKRKGNVNDFNAFVEIAKKEMPGSDE